MNELVLLLAFGLVALVIGYLSWEAERKRRLILRALARHLGLSFTPDPDQRLHRAYAHGVFQKGRSREGRNTLHGQMTLAGYPIRVRMGDYRYVTGHGRDRQTHRLSYALFQLPFVGTPSLLIRKEHLGDKIASGVGFDDIDFESEEFSRRFWVKSDNERFAYDVIHPRMMEFLLGNPTPHVEIVQDVCLLLEGARRWDPETFEAAPRWFAAFLRLWPEHVTEGLRPRSP